MKRSFIVFVCMNFCSVFPSESKRNDRHQLRQQLVQKISQQEQQANNARQHQVFQLLTGPLFDDWIQQLQQEQRQKQPTSRLIFDGGGIPELEMRQLRYDAIRLGKGKHLNQYKEEDKELGSDFEALFNSKT